MCSHTTVFTLFKASVYSSSLVKKLQPRRICSQCYFLGVHGKQAFIFKQLLIAFFPSPHLYCKYIHIFKYAEMKSHLNYSELPKHSKVKYVLLVLHLVSRLWGTASLHILILIGRSETWDLRPGCTGTWHSTTKLKQQILSGYCLMITQWELATWNIVADISVATFSFISQHVFYPQNIPRSVMGV